MGIGIFAKPFPRSCLSWSLDLERNGCYGQRNHWNGPTDGRWKSIYHALGGEEQLLDLRADPGEGREAELRLWRGRLAAHFEERGEPFLKGGELNPRPEGYLDSPRFPDGGLKG